MAIRSEADAAELLGELKTTLAVELRAEQALKERRAPMDSRMRDLEETIRRRRTEMQSYEEADQQRADGKRGAGRGMRLRPRAGRGANLPGREPHGRAHPPGGVRPDAGKASSPRPGASFPKYADQRGPRRCGSPGSACAWRASTPMRRSATAWTCSPLSGISTPSSPPFRTRSSPAAARSATAGDTISTRTREAEAETPVGEDSVPEEGVAPVAEFSAPVEPETADSALCLDPEMEALLEDGPDWEFVENSVTELKQRLDSMGPVNMDAIQEYEELEERHNFLQRENDELVNAKTELMAIIQRINVESKKRFTDTFYQVRDNFRSSFKELFGNAGQADLILVNEEDPLESGIDVIAKPPGKKPTSITLLSGGERSMTAVALLFSIYMVKPSPFCILDELDAPLDESNIGRFLKMLDKFIEKSQFVIVTHNKRTMRRADILYGVTMEEFGVSKPVGMKMSGESERPRDQYTPPPAMDAVAPTPKEEEPRSRVGIFPLAELGGYG